MSCEAVWAVYRRQQKPSNVNKMIRNISRFPAALVACLFLMLAAGRTPAQRAATPVPVNTASGKAVGNALKAKPRATQSEGELLRVVALFRHGVRAPLKDLNDDSESTLASRGQQKLNGASVKRTGGTSQIMARKPSLRSAAITLPITRAQAIGQVASTFFCGRT